MICEAVEVGEVVKLPCLVDVKAVYNLNINASELCIILNTVKGTGLDSELLADSSFGEVDGVVLCINSCILIQCRTLEKSTVKVDLEVAGVLREALNDLVCIVENGKIELKDEAVVVTYYVAVVLVNDVS